MGTTYNQLNNNEKRIVDAYIDLWKRPDIFAQNRQLEQDDIETLREIVSMRDRIFLANKILYIELMFRDLETRAKHLGSERVSPGMPMNPELKSLCDAKNALRFYRREAVLLLAEKTTDPFRREFITVGINNCQLNAIKAINEVENQAVRRGNHSFYHSAPMVMSAMAAH